MKAKVIIEIEVSAEFHNQATQDMVDELTTTLSTILSAQKNNPGFKFSKARVRSILKKKR